MAVIGTLIVLSSMVNEATRAVTASTPSGPWHQRPCDAQIEQCIMFVANWRCIDQG